MMTTAQPRDEFARRLQEIVEEIKKHKWLESEKAGSDIGGNKAALDWIHKHYESWKKDRGYQG